MQKLILKVWRVVNELTLISGQKAIITTAKNDISNFKIRKGWPVGCKVTLRSKKMYEFLERLISIACLVQGFQRIII